MASENLSPKNYPVSSFLVSVPSFAHLSAEQLEIFNHVAVQRVYEKDEIILLEGDNDTNLYIVQDGWLKAIKGTPKGREQILFVLKPNEYFNVLPVFADIAIPFSVVAIQQATILVLEKEAILCMAMNYPHFAMGFIRSLSFYVQHLIGLAEDLSLRTVEARLAHYLLEQPVWEQPDRQHWATQAEIAAQLGTVPDVVSRAIRTLASEELIRVEHHHIEILDRKKLEEKAKTYL